MLRILKSKGCGQLRQKGSHARWACGVCKTTIPIHSGEELGRGLLAQIERDLEPCLGVRWLKPHLK